ncbi:HdeD family acid-resistance protein [Alloalcanivorax xenomutans]|uniref:DUF308 domain-containing protein n=1 Tax=Alloalcanivorax xenomutans TaxID=1094342 RepID=A0A9Q3ZF38_9GAMM|nr:DUF308 domain-containing protein [Alloalcanivorax xenomutans]KYZ85666.1 hypothetical protein A3Q32_05535 [Alcanivorax sp. KX64203]MBA4719776.1 DUF308 domain-containing protein [Alcanivorax sp.]ARB47621.1 hypothetical protein P40_21230 [Alloalcanivorax xenomutans]MCE7507509.1 DUF308 domain-containing protein [Alloalcanivorax xenomutans]PHS72270.1 MAG: hypothetical protein COB00_01360 [Alcanivorax sp.]
MTSDPASVLLSQLARHWKGLLTLGIVFVVLGTLGLGAVGLFTLVGVLWFGAILIFGGVLQIAQAFRASGLPRSLLFLAIGLLYALLGLYVVSQPQAAAGALTLLIALALVLTGLLRLLLAWQMSPVVSPWLPALTGVLGLVLAGMIFSEWPESSAWVIGLFIAIELLLNGWMLIMVALTVRRRASS